MESTGREQAVVWEARRDDPEAPGAQRCRTARRPEREDRGAGTRGSPDKQTEQRTQTREAKVSASEGEARGPDERGSGRGMIITGTTQDGFPQLKVASPLTGALGRLGRRVATSAS